MSYSVALMRKMDGLDPDLKEVLWAILDEIEQHREASVTKEDFSELKAIVREQGENLREQGRILSELTVTVKELAEAQKQTERELAKLSRGLAATRSQLGGLW